jgi:cytidylate kinase
METVEMNVETKTGCEIAVDGRAASGKSACAKVADALGFSLLDTGAIYRTAALIVLETCDDVHDPKAAEKALRWQIPFVGFEGKKLVFRGRIIGNEIRTPQIDALVPHVSKHLAVRRLVTSVQHRFAKGRRVVAEGRDMTSKVFTDAKVKIFMTASLAVRAERRRNQRLEKNPSYSATVEDVMEELEDRDHEDENREHCPLVHVPEAAYIDTTHMEKDQVVRKILEIYEERTSA